MTAVTVEDLSKRYGRTEALSSLSFEVEPGEVFGLVGPDGAGKSTMIKILATLLKPTSGKASIFGYDVYRQAEEVRRLIGYMPQSFSLYTELTVEENLDFFSDLYQVAPGEKASRLKSSMSFSRLEPFKKRLAGHLSGGMKQKLALCCALIHTPKILLLDEPTTGVDPVSRHELWKLLYDICQEGVTLVVATPNIEEAERFGRLAIIDRGFILDIDSPDRLRSRLKCKILELELSRPDRAMEILSPSQWAKGLRRIGNTIRIPLDDEKAMVAVRRLLDRNGLAVTAFNLREPGLEDVLLNLNRDR